MTTDEEKSTNNNTGMLYLFISTKFFKKQTACPIHVLNANWCLCDAIYKASDILQKRKLLRQFFFFGCKQYIASI